MLFSNATVAALLACHRIMYAVRPAIRSKRVNENEIDDANDANNANNVPVWR